MDETITKLQAYLLIQHQEENPFVVIFEKKDGKMRLMRCYTDVYKTGERIDLPYMATKQGYLPVIDTEIDEERVVNLNTITDLRIDGRWYTVE